MYNWLHYTDCSSCDNTQHIISVTHTDVSIHEESLIDGEKRKFRCDEKRASCTPIRLNCKLNIKQENICRFFVWF